MLTMIAYTFSVSSNSLAILNLSLLSFSAWIMTAKITYVIQKIISTRGIKTCYVGDTRMPINVWQNITSHSGYTYIHTYTHLHIHTRTHTHKHKYTCTHIRKYMHIDIYTYIHTYVHTQTHTHIQTKLHMHA